MDPNLFHLDWERLSEVLAVIVVLAILLERALALVFEHRLFVKRLEESGWKMPIALLVALFVCVWWQFDALSMIILRDKTHPVGYLITAAIVAGGSKGSIKLFRDVLGWQSTAYREYTEAKSAPRKSNPGSAPN